MFTQSFEATYPLTTGAAGDLKLTVHFQGCDHANCFFPEDQTFSISPAGTIARLDEPREATRRDSRRLAKCRGQASLSQVAGVAISTKRNFFGFLDKAKPGMTAAESSPPAAGSGASC